MSVNILFWIYCTLLLAEFSTYPRALPLTAEQTTQRNATVPFVPVPEPAGIAEQISRHLHSVATWLKSLTKDETIAGNYSVRFDYRCCPVDEIETKVEETWIRKNR